MYLHPKWWRRIQGWTSYWWYVSEPYGEFRLSETTNNHTKQVRKTWIYSNPNPKHVEVLERLGWIPCGMSKYDKDHFRSDNERIVEGTMAVLGLKYGRVYHDEFTYVI